jgi:outer membrane receptor for ferrienterochelin and colicin
MLLSKKNSCFLLVLLIFSQIGFAQGRTDAGVKDLFSISLEDLLNVGIVSASKKKQSVSDAPAMAYVFTKEQILSRGYTNLLDLLDDVPEIEIQRNSTAEDRNFVTIRGIAGNEKFLILLNGIRITPTTGDAYTLGSNFSLINALRVEVILGPASALYGVDAFSGIINIITNQGQEGTAFSGVNANVAYGQFRSTDASLQLGAKFPLHKVLGMGKILQMGRKYDKITFSAAGNYYRSAEPDYQNIYKDEFAWYNERYRPNGQVVLSPGLRIIRPLDVIQSAALPYISGDSLSRTFAMPTESYFVNATANYGDFSVSYAKHSESHSSAYGLRPEFSIRDKSALIEMSQQILVGKHRYTHGSGKWNLQSTLLKSDFEIGNQSNFAGSATTWQRGYIYSRASSIRLEEQFSYDFSKKASVIIGFSAENLTSIPKIAPIYKPFDKSTPPEQQQLYYVSATGNNIPRDTLIRNIFVEQRVSTIEYQNYGGYVQFQLTPAKWIELTLGSRYDYNTRFAESINPRLGLVVSTNDKKLRFRVLYGEAFLAPSPEKTFTQSASFAIRLDNPAQPNTSTGNRLATYFRTANPDLKPEKLRTLESSVSYFLTPTLALGVNGYYTQLENLITLATIGRNTTIDNGILPRNLPINQLDANINRGESSIYGLTTKLNYLQKFGFFSINAQIAYSYIDGDIDEQPLLYTAKHTVKATLDITWARFSISPRIVYRSASNSRLPNANNDNLPATNSPFAVINLFARVKILDKRKVGKIYAYTRINNLMDLRYYHVLFGSEDGFPATPQDPQRLNFGINWILE